MSARTPSHLRALLATVVAFSVAVPSPSNAYPRPGATERVSVSGGGVEQVGFSLDASISADGRFVAFVSRGETLVDGDTNAVADIFVHDRESGTTERVSVRSDGTEATGYSHDPAISADGRYVAFSSASALVEGDRNEYSDVYVHDRLTRTTKLVSAAPTGAAGDLGGHSPAIDADGDTIAFVGWASDLVPDDRNDTSDVFVRDMSRGVTERVSVSTSGGDPDRISWSVSISGDGRRVAFMSEASNLVPLDTNGIKNASDGRDIFVRDLDLGQTERVSLGSDAAQSNGRSSWPTISRDGTVVAFESEATNLVPNDDNFLHDIFVRSLVDGTTARVSLSSFANGGSVFYNGGLSVSADGRYVAFSSSAPDLVPEDPGMTDPVLVHAYLGSGLPSQVYVHDMWTGTTERASLSGRGEVGSRSSRVPSISDDGRFVAFESDAADLIDGDGNDQMDIFVRDRGPSFGIGALRVETDGARATASGSVRTPLGAAVDAAPAPGGAHTGARELGAEIRRARVLHRPEEGDLLLTTTVSTLPGYRSPYGGSTKPTIPGVPLNPWGTFPESHCPTCYHPSVSGAPAVSYGWSFTVGAVRYEIRAQRFAETAPAAKFELHRCEAECSVLAALRGGLGTAAEDVRVSIPLELIGLQGGSVVSEISSFTELLHTVATGAALSLHRVELPTLVVHEPRLSIGVAPADAPADAVRFEDATAAMTDGTFQVTVEHAPGQRVWARVCVAAACDIAFADTV